MVLRMLLRSASSAFAIALAITPVRSLGAPETPSAPPDDPGHAEIALATFNTWGLPSPIATDRRGRLPRIATWLDAGGFDVVGLQEVWHEAVSLLPARGLFAPDHGGDSGLALVTRHEVREATLHAYEAERGLDAWKAKGVLVAELDMDGQPLTVAVTHLQSGGGGRNASVRAAQVDELLAALPDDDAPVVLLGDFNLYEGASTDVQTEARLEQAGFVDAAAEAGATGGTYPGRSDRFDRIYVRDGANRSLTTRSARVVADRDWALSDHRAVEARIVSGDR